MGFPLSADGRIHAKGIDVSRAIEAVERLLRSTKASTIAVHDNRLDFTVRFLRLGSNWNLLVPIDSGRVVFREREDAIDVEYHISLRRWFFIVTGMMIVVFAVVPLIAIGPAGGVPVPFLLFLWLFLFGGNYFIAALRFPAALRSSLDVQ
jgi:hypothetical protein